MTQHRRGEPAAIALDPGLALARAERDDDEVGAASVDAFDRVVTAQGFDRCKRRLFVADAAQPPGAPLERGRSRLAGANGTSEKVDRDRRTGMGEQAVEQLRSCHPFRNRQLQQPGHPDQRHAVGQTQIAADDRFAELGVGLRRDHEVEVRRRDHAARLRMRRMPHLLDRGPHVDRIDRQAGDAIDVSVEVGRRQCQAG